MAFWPQTWSTLTVSDIDAISPPSGAARGSLDEVALVVEAGAPRGFYLRGWAALDACWSTLSDLTLVLRSEESAFTCPLVREPREDVAQAYGDSAYLHSGYRALVPLEPLADGEYEVMIALRSGARDALLETHATLVVRDGRPCLPQPEPRELWHVIHVPKTGGSSFRQLLEHTYGDALSLYYEGRILVRANTRCIQGHNYASTFLHFRPDTRLLMWFRDPVERVVSEYLHWRRLPDVYPMNGEDVLQFALRREMLNVQRRVLDGVALSRIDCVCITEHFQASLALCSRMLVTGTSEVTPQNTNPDKPLAQRYSLPPELRAQIARANQADYELYARARERFVELCRAYGLDQPRAAVQAAAPL